MPRPKHRGAACDAGGIFQIQNDGDTGNKDAAPHKDPNPVDIFGMSRRAIAFMKKNHAAKKPFFIQLSYHALHYSQNALQRETHGHLSGGDGDGEQREQRPVQGVRVFAEPPESDEIQVGGVEHDLD